eukprot:CCRYP_013206-RA/>CCRYP_013206-RA protein AED:0.43 eAED:0.43 QI:0/-1/0/1/-1/1/1/0/224
MRTARTTSSASPNLPLCTRPHGVPPVYPINDDAATAVVQARREAKHAILVCDFASYEAAKRATAKFIRDAANKIWYRDLCHDRSFYMHVMAKQLLSHLDDNCGGLHPSEFVNLPTNMLGFYATVDGIPEYINMLEVAQRKLAHANLPMSDDQLLAIASTAVLALNHFLRPTDDWEAKPPRTKHGQCGKPTTAPPTLPESANASPLKLPCHPQLPTHCLLMTTYT